MAKGFLLPALALVVSASRGVLSAPAAGMTTNVTTPDLNSPTPSEAENKQVAQAELVPSVAVREERMPSNPQAAEKVLSLAEHLRELKLLQKGQTAEEGPQLGNRAVNWLASKGESSNRAHGTRVVPKIGLSDQEREGAYKIEKLYSFAAGRDVDPEMIYGIARRNVRDDDLEGIIAAKNLEWDYRRAKQDITKRKAGT